MDTVSWMTLGVAGLLSLLLVATLITVPLRRMGKGSGVWSVLVSPLSLPLSVLALSSLLWWVVWAFPAAFGPLPVRRTQVEAWYLFWLFFLLFNLSEGIGRLYHTHFRPDMQAAHGTLYFLGRIGIVGASLLIVLQFAMELDISQFLTSAAVIAAAVGFALREMLGNFLAGLSVHLAGAIYPSQWIAIGEKEGEIIQRNWRETRIRSTAGHIYIVPNSTIANSVVNQMTWGSPLRRHHLEFPVDFSVSPAQVCQALREAARSVPEVDCTGKQPDAMVLACKEHAMVYRVRFWSRTFHDRTRIEGDVQERAWYQLQRRGIAMGAITELKVPGLSPLLPEQGPPPESVYDLLWRSGFVYRFLTRNGGPLLVEDAVLRTFAGMVQRRLYGPGERLLGPGDAGDFCCIHLRGALHGRTELAALKGQGEFTVEVGDWAGELALFSGLPRTATLFVKEGEVEVLTVPGHAFHYLLAAHAEVARIFQRKLAERSRKMVEELHALAGLQRVPG